MVMLLRYRLHTQLPSGFNVSWSADPSGLNSVFTATGSNVTNTQTCTDGEQLMTETAQHDAAQYSMHAPEL